jgi:group I intron endonuclease
MLLYKITNKINEKIYIGQTTRSLNVRWNEHKRDFKKIDNKLSRAVKKYGIENFTIEKIEECESLEVLNKKEASLIEEYDTIKNGYNIRIGGENSPRSKETREKISKKHKGKKHTEEHIQNMMKARTGVKPKNKDKYFGNKNKLGKKHTNLFKEKCRKRMLNNNFSKKRAVKCLNNNIIYESIVEACKRLSLDSRSVQRVLKGEYKQTKGYKFQYHNPNKGV